MIFHYSLVPGLRDNFKRPILPVTFINGKKEFPTFALLDSGADVTAISTRIGDELGLNWQKAYSQKGTGVSGNYHFYPITGLEINIFKFHLALKVVDVVENMSDIYPCLLGQIDLFDNTEIIFRRYKETFEIIPVTQLKLRD